MARHHSASNASEYNDEGHLAPAYQHQNESSASLQDVTMQSAHQYATADSLPARNLASPPRYASRASLGSVAFGPGRSPGSAAAAARQFYQPQAAVSSGQAHHHHVQDSVTSYNASDDPRHHQDAQHRQLGSLPDRDAHYHQYFAHHSSMAPSSSDSHARGHSPSPDLDDLEAQLAEQEQLGQAFSTSPATDPSPVLQDQHGYGGSPRATVGASSTAFSYSPRKRAAPPAPLDLSPPKPSWMRTREQHPAIHASPGGETSRQERRIHSNPAREQAYPSRAPAEYTRASGSRLPASRSDASLHAAGGQAYTGLGLGLPFSHSSTSDSLNSLPSSSSGGEIARSYDAKLASPLSGSQYSGSNSTSYNNSSSLRKQRSASDILSSPSDNRSPIVDRRGLVGLGELSTPRWTAAIHERRWNHHPLPEPMPDQEDPDEKAETQESEGWEGSVLGGYMDEKENDHYATHRKSMPNADSYRSFSDIANTTTGQISTSSSAYSLGGLSVPDTGSSSSSSEAGAFYSPSVRELPHPNPLDSAAMGNAHSTDQHTFKAPRDKSAPKDGLASSTSSTILSPTSRTQIAGSRASSRSTRSTSVQSTSRCGDGTAAAGAGSLATGSGTRNVRERERDLPSYMKSTAASSNKCSSVASADEESNSVPKRREPGQASLTSPDAPSSRTSSRTRYSSPPQQPHQTGAPPRAARSLAHSRQSSIASTSGKRNIPGPINTSRIQGDTLPSRSGEARHSTRVSHSPSAIAHNILRHTKGADHESFDMSAYAAADEATAEALRKLDGTSSISSPRISRALSNGSGKSTHTGGGSVTEHTPRKVSGPGSSLSRQNSKASSRTTSPHSRPASSRKSWARSQPSQAPFAIPSQTANRDLGDGKTFLQSQAQDPTLQPPLKSPLRALNVATTSSAPNTVTHNNIAHVHTLPSSNSVPSLPGTGIAQSFSDTSAKSPTAVQSPTVTFAHSNAPSLLPRRGSGARPSSSTGDAPLTPSNSSKRSSSASLAFATSTTGSRDSTSATSTSAYGSPAAQVRTTKSRRGSMSSDVSSLHSNGESLSKIQGDSADADSVHTGLIPPVPPLPKDWELYRPSTSGEGSVPSSASAASFKEKDKDLKLGVSSLSESRLLSGSSSRRASMDKPAGPRPLRNVSGPPIGSPSLDASSLPSSPALPSPATMATSSIGLPVDRRQDTSKTPTKPKWSLSNALGIHRSPPLPTSTSQASSLASQVTPSLEKTTSYGDLVPASRRHGTRDNRASLAPALTGSELSRRQLASVPDIQGLATGKEQTASGAAGQGIPHSVSAHHLGGLTALERARTASISSTSTTNASGAEHAPSLVATSPGRSKSSLLTPRRTPSGIPFFSRRASGQASVSKAPSMPNSPNIQQSFDASIQAAQPEEKTGRRSILGINLFQRSSARKSLSLARDSAAIPASPKLPKEYKASTSSSAATVTTHKRDDKPSEFGVRPSEDSKRGSMSTRASSLIGRKRGKTLPSSTESPVKNQHVVLPPMQINALPPATVSRVEGLAAEENHGQGAGSSQSRPLPVPPPALRQTRAMDSGREGMLPTITGSPSVTVNATAGSSDVNIVSSKPSTPTRIPRLASSRSNAASPQYLQASSPGIDTTKAKSDLPYRQAEAMSLPGMSSSVPQPSSSYLATFPSSATPSSTSTEESPTGQNAEQSVHVVNSTEDENHRRRKASSFAQIPSQVPVFSSSRASGKYSTPAATSIPDVSAVQGEKRRSLILENKDLKSVRPPLRGNQSTSSHRVLSKTQPTTSINAAAASSIGSVNGFRVRTKTNDAATPDARATGLTGGLPISKSVSASLASKLSIPSRMSKSATTSSLRQSPAPSDGGGRSTSSSRYGTPIGEDELKGDEEMGEFVSRQRSKQASRGMSNDDIDRLFTFPDPIEPDTALTPRDALQRFGHQLSEYEADEIHEHKDVYFVGTKEKKKLATRSDSTNNYGYDDERGDYQVIEGDHIMFRYEIIDTLGKGSFGQVLRCRDHKTGHMVAVKIIRNKKRFHHQALVEIKVLENLKSWDPEEKNCLLIIGDHFTFRGHLCITTELLGMNLYELIKANSFRGFTTNLIRRFTVQILSALTLLRHHRVVHCDLKPENILLKHPARSAIKVIDFGSSCFENEKVYTYIQSRFYRSPEVILGMNYHMAIDMWSLGCILAELYTGMPIFPGENEASQLACIMEVLGVPDKHIVDRSSRKKLFFDSMGTPRPVVDSKGRRRRPGAKNLQSVLKCDDELFVDFIAKCLTWDPDRRLKPGPALRHPFCAKYRGTLLAAPIPPRSSTASSRSFLRTSNISTPRRLEKKSTDASSVYATPSSHHHASLPATAPGPRLRTHSTAVHGSVGPSYTSYRSYAK